MKAGQTAENFRRVSENKYKRALSRVVSDLKNILKGKQKPEDVMRAVNGYSTSRSFRDLVDMAVRRMANFAKVGQRATWRQAARESTRGREIFEALRSETDGSVIGKAIEEIILSNSKLIKTVPSDVAERLSKLAAEGARKGIRPEQIAKQMREKAPDLAKYQLMRIARTETAKAQTALNQARCEELGVKWYIWHTCQDERVRSSHRGMQGVYCRWSDPPEPEKLFPSDQNRPAGHYHPGGIYNCRCIALPVVDEHDLHFPAKVYANGRIRTVNNAREFKKLA